MKGNAIIQADAIARKIGDATDTLSKQPRFTEEGAGGFGSVLYFAKMTEIEQPPYAANSMHRDSWLRAVWHLEPRLAGVLNAVTLIDSNRGWTLTGGRNQVNRYTSILHAADGGSGWRSYARRASLSYWTTDMGSVTEIGRDGQGGPLRALYHVDSARAQLTGDIEAPLYYYPAQGGQQAWEPRDYFRVCSMPSDDEAYHGLGFCAVSRCIEILRLLYAVMCHDQEQVAARAPKGLLLLHNISQQQWDDSLAVRNAKEDSLERAYYGGVQVLASPGMDQIDAKLVALSNLPQNFDAKVFMDLSMYAYALAFGYDPGEFWPVQFGSLGRGTESQQQYQKATSKGGMEFALAIQEQLQEELPETLAFEFEQREEASELIHAQVSRAKVDVVAAAYTAGLMQGAPLVSRDEARQLLVQEGMIPAEWTEAEEDVQATDTEDADATEEPAPGEEPPAEAATRARRRIERALDSEPVRLARDRWPREPIVQSIWPGRQTRVLWEPKRRLWPVRRGTLYSKGDVTITDEDVDKAIAAWDKRMPDKYKGMLSATVVKD